MKYKVTMKAVKQSHMHILRVGYCALQVLLRHIEPTAYTSGMDGWHADIYEVGHNVAIVTGYQTFGTISPSYTVVRRYEKLATSVLENSKLTHEQQLQKLDELLAEFIAIVLDTELLQHWLNLPSTCRLLATQSYHSHHKRVA